MTKGFKIPWALAVLLLLSVTAATYFGFFAFEGAAAVRFVKETGYWFMVVTFGLLLLNFGLGFMRGAYGPLRWPFGLKASVFLAAMSVLLCVLIGDGYKIVMDEPVLASTALQMYQEQEAITAARGYDLFGDFVLLDAFVDKRPLFFPFLLSLLHALFGYDGLQGVFLNTILTPILLAQVFYLCRRIAGEAYGYAGVLLLSTVPLLAMNANGAGFELLNLSMILATCIAVVAYLDRATPERLNMMLLLAILLAQTRYESALYILPVALVVLLTWWREKQVTITRTMLLVPPLLVLFAVQQGVFQENPELWQYKGEATVPFSLSFLPGNLTAAADYFFSWELDQPNSLLLSVLFMLALPCLPWALRSHGHDIREGYLSPLASLFFAGVVLIGFLLLMTYHWGQLNDIIATRIALPFITLQVFVVIAVASWLFASSRFSVWACAFPALWLLVVTVPSVLSTDYLEEATESASCNVLRQWVLEEKAKRPLFLTNQHLVAINEKVSGLALFNATRRKAQLDLHSRLGTFGAIYFVYTVEAAGELQPEQEWQSHFLLQPVRRHELGQGKILMMDVMTGVVENPGDIVLPVPEIEDLRITSPETMSFYAETLP